MTGAGRERASAPDGLVCYVTRHGREYFVDESKLGAGCDERERVRLQELAAAANEVRS